MTTATVDPALYYAFEDTTFQGATATYVDDTLNIGHDSFLRRTDITNSLFESREREFNNLCFAGTEMSQNEKYTILHQSRHANKLKELGDEVDYSKFKSLVMTLAWLVQTRPDIACAVGQLAQVTDEHYQSDPSDFRTRINKVIKHIHKEPDRGIRYTQLQPEGLHLRVYADGSFANNQDESSQLGYIIALCDKHGNSCLLAYKSFKSRRVLRSILATEAAALAEAFDLSIVIAKELRNTLNQDVEIDLYTDSKSLFDIITRGSSASNKGLMIDLKALQQAYQRFDIRSIYNIASEFNPADAMTKAVNNATLVKLATQGMIDHPIEQTVHRNLSNANSSREEEVANVDEHDKLDEAFTCWMEDQLERWYDYEVGGSVESPTYDH